MNAPARTGSPSVRYCDKPWLDASNAACVTPSRRSPAMFARKVTISGVVSPVATLPSGVVTPSVPIEAALCPAIRHSWRTSSTVEVLPLVPVTATTSCGNGAKNFAASRANALRGSPSAMCAAPVTRASGRATTATAPAETASSMKLSPSNRAPLNAPNTVPGATLR